MANKEPTPDDSGAGGALTRANSDTDVERTVLSQQISVARSLPGRSMGVQPVDGEAIPVREVGRYQIIEKLGEGAMASVYKAYDPSINRPLVIKFLHQELCRDAEYRARFVREARAAGMLSHPGIVTVFDVGEIEGRPYIAMELLDGGPLADITPQDQVLPVRDVVDMGIQIASALDYAHAKGIFHRDIKPSNIIRIGDGKTIKLADFGIAAMSVGDNTAQTRVGTVIGTPHYMAPEQAMGEKTDARSDLWAVGVVLYQLLSGRRPFEADSMVTLVYRIAKEDPQPLGELRKDVPQALRRIVARCLEKRPEKRFQSGRELADALTQVRSELDAERDVDKEGKPRRLPLKLKLAIVMAGVVAATMALASQFVTHRQYQTMLAQTVDQGVSVARLIAAESAVPTLSEDWVGVDVFVQEVARALSVEELSVADRQGVVRVSTNERAVGKRAEAVQGEAVSSRNPSVAVRQAKMGDKSAFVFDAPIRFQDKQLGTVRLAMSEEPLAAAVKQALWLLFVLMLVTAAAVTLATYLVVERYSKPLKVLGDSLEEIAEGRFAVRIGEQRNDEIGRLYETFDRMAERLQKSSHATQDGPRAGDRPAEVEGTDPAGTPRLESPQGGKA
jgi:serine/threonine-protein kinase